MNRETSNLSAALLPAVARRVEGIESAEALVIITARSLRASTVCPCCQTPTSRLHRR